MIFFALEYVECIWNNPLFCSWFLIKYACFWGMELSYYKNKYWQAIFLDNCKNFRETLAKKNKA